VLGLGEVVPDDRREGRKEADSGGHDERGRRLRVVVRLVEGHQVVGGGADARRVPAEPDDPDDHQRDVADAAQREQTPDPAGTPAWILSGGRWQAPVENR